MVESAPLPSVTETRVRELLVKRLGLTTFLEVSSRPLLWRAFGYLGQSARAYDAAADLASSVMSRAAVEAAFLALETYELRDGMMYLKIKGLSKGKFQRSRFDELYVHAQKRIRFSDGELRAISQIKEDGDLSAHAAERDNKSTVDAVTGRVLPTSKISDDGKSLDFEPRRLSPSHSEAEGNQIQSTEILCRVVTFMWPARVDSGTKP